MDALWLAARSLLWTVIFPGTMTVFLPWRYFGLSAVRPDIRDPLHWSWPGSIAM